MRVNPLNRSGRRAVFVVLLLSAIHVQAQAAPRFIGPLASAGQPLPKGTINIEPYLVSTHAAQRFDAQGRRHRTDAEAGLALLLPMQYGLTDRLTLSTTLTGQYDRTPQSERRAAAGDTTLGAQYALHRGDGPHALRWAASVRSGLPTGRHDRLAEDRAGSGGGARTTTLGMQGQALFLDGHLRARATASWRLPASHARIDGRSVYGTAAGFHGRARLGSRSSATVAAEYSIDPRWTLVAEALYEQDRGTRIRGRLGDGPAFDTLAPASWRLSLLPAVEYHLSDRVGVLLGVQVGVAGRNTAAVVAPQVAVNMVF